MGGKGEGNYIWFPHTTKYEALNVTSSVMCVHVCALMSTQCLPDDTFISNVHIDLLLSGCSLDFSVTSGSYNPHIQSATK